jgi:hypothetical protein
VQLTNLGGMRSAYSSLRTLRQLLCANPIVMLITAVITASSCTAPRF